MLKRLLTDSALAAHECSFAPRAAAIHRTGHEVVIKAPDPARNGTGIRSYRADRRAGPLNVRGEGARSKRMICVKNKSVMTERMHRGYRRNDPRLTIRVQGKRGVRLTFLRVLRIFVGIRARIGSLSHVVTRSCRAGGCKSQVEQACGGVVSSPRLGKTVACTALTETLVLAIAIKH